MAWNKVDTEKTPYDPTLFETLLKAQDPSVPSAARMYQDTLIPEVGNLLTYRTTEPLPGAHVRADLSDMGEINDHHGNEVGNEVLKLFGKVSHELATKYGGTTSRYGGDEFAFHFDRPDDAHAFARTIRSTMEKMGKVGGTHNFAAAIGIAPTAPESEAAMKHAKTMRLRPDGSKKYQDGDAPTVIYSTIDLAPADQ